MEFGLKKEDRWTIQGQAIKTVDTINNLGIILDCMDTWGNRKQERC
jgi:hypothetical protein